MFTLKNKNILITGASSGIGRECAVLCSKLGASVVIIGRNQEKLLQTYSQLVPGNHHNFAVDITQYEELENIINISVAQTGKISGFIHSAGLELTTPLSFMKPELYEKIFNINVIAGFEISRLLALKRNFDNNGCSFVFIGSVMGLLGQSGKIAYCSSKGALVAGAKAMALELAGKGIRVNTISPGVVLTEMTKKLFDTISPESVESIRKMHPLGFGTPLDVANACAYLLSDGSKWITGSNLIIDGGYSAM